MSDPEFWDTNDEADWLLHDTIDEALESHLEDNHRFPVRRKVVVYGFTRRKFDISADRIASFIAEQFDNWFDEPFGDPDNLTELPKDLNDAIKELADKVVEKWPVWRCDVTENVEIDLVKWAAENLDGVRRYANRLGG